MRIYDPVTIARQFKFVRETLGENRGVFVEAFQRVGDGKPGDSWCMDFASFVLFVCYQGPCAIPRTGSTVAALDAARAKSLIVPTPQVNDLFFRVNAQGQPHHVGFVTQVYPDRIGSIAGNTSADGMSSNGTGVFEHDLILAPSLVFVRIPTTST